jgi:hypothetical protein
VPLQRHAPHDEEGSDDLKTLSGLDHPLTLRQAIEGGLDQYKAVFVPEDLRP